MWYLSFWWDSAESISNSNMSSFSSLLAMVKCKMCYSHNIFKVGSNLFCLSFSLLQASPGVLSVVSMLTATTKLQWVCVISASPAPTHVQECTDRAASLLCTVSLYEFKKQSVLLRNQIKKYINNINKYLRLPYDHTFHFHHIQVVLNSLSLSLFSNFTLLMTESEFNLENAV